LAEAAAIGISPAQFWRCTPRELFATFTGYGTRMIRERQRLLWAAWSTANFSRAKKLPALEPLLRKLENSQVTMSDKQLRETIIGVAMAMGAKVTHKKKGDD
jgi:hypothetical protein